MASGVSSTSEKIAGSLNQNVGGLGTSANIEYDWRIYGEKFLYWK